MNAREFHDKYGTDVVKEVCAKVGTSYGYWKGVKGLYRNVSAERALMFAEASNEITGDPMTVVDLLGFQHVPAALIGKGKEK
jgi:hypothetical protein